MKKLIQRRSASVTFDNAGAPFGELARRVLANRDVVSPEQVDYQLRQLEAPATMLGLQAACDLLVEALREQKRICILGDFDADGATSTTLAVRCLRAFGCRHVDFVVPNRFEYGYGLTPEIVTVIAAQRPQLLLTVDNGIASVDGVRAAQALGMQVIVTDHHLPGRELPSAEAIVNPNQVGCEFGSKNLAGVGVIFYVMSALRARLKALGWFDKGDIAEPKMADWLDLVALGTVADVVPLDQNNRVLVAQGLKRMRAARCVPGIQALFEVAGRPLNKVTASDLGFIAGPRLNAAGRLDDMGLGIRCLLTDSIDEARGLARELDSLNRERRAIEGSMQVEAVKLLDDFASNDADWPLGVCLYKTDWHQGVIGILASRIKDRLHRPTIVFAEDGEGQLKGSGRSISGVHLRDVLDRVATQNPGLLTKFGGHAMAAGLSLALQDLDRFKTAFELAVGEALGFVEPEASLATDGELEQEDFDLSVAKTLQALGPWGQAFPEPSFDGEFRLLQQRIVGEKHLKLLVSPADYSGVAIDAIAFNVDLDTWPNNDIQFARIVYKLAINEYRGEEKLQLLVDYLEELE
jgi:exonuclease RecJ (EC 3.1.-.-)